MVAADRRVNVWDSLSPSGQTSMLCHAVLADECVEHSAFHTHLGAGRIGAVPSALGEALL